LPLVLSINRGTPPERLLIPVARSLGVSLPPEEWSGALKELADQTRSLIDSRQFVDIEEQRGAKRHYLSWLNIADLFGRTVLDELLRPMALDLATTNQPWLGEDSGTMLDTRAVNLGDAHEEALIQSETMSGLKLALATEGDDLGVVRVDRSGAGSLVRYLRPFWSESLQGLQTARFTARSETGSVIEGSLGHEYVEARRQLGSQHYQWLLTVERQELLRLVAGLALHMQKIHDTGQIHGDLKPANLLLLDGGLSAIDSLNLSLGQVSTGLSRGYAAPEQVLGEPVCPQTDQYALGIMLAQICNGVLYGEEARFHIPVGTGRLEVFTMLKSPGVFLSPSQLNVAPAGLRALRSLIQRCLAFNPGERYESMRDLANQLMDYLDSYEFSAHLECGLRYGNLCDFEDAGLAWLLEDHHP